MSLLETAVKKDLARLVAIALAASGIFLLAILRLGRYVADHSGEPVIPWLVALTGVGLTALAVAAMRSVRRMDELERHMHAEAMAFAFLCSVLIIATYTFMKVAGLKTPPVDCLLPTMMSCWALGVLLAFRRYR